LGRAEASRQGPALSGGAPPTAPASDTASIDENNPDLAVRDGKWKFMINYDGNEPQLYDLQADVAETKNLIREFPDVAARLKQAVRDWNETMPTDAGDPSHSGEPAAPRRQRNRTTQ
jgi:arylsulfatase A-like enzyme